MEEYPSNSQRVRPVKRVESNEPATEKNIRPVAQAGEAKLRKKPLGRRMADAFTGDDGRTVVQHVVWDVMIPAARDMVVDAGMEALHRAFYGESRGSRRSSYGGRPTLAGHVNYGAATRASYDPRDRKPEPVKRKPLVTTDRDMDYRDIVLPSRVLAEETIDQMFELLAKFGQVTVADLFDIVGITGPWTDDGFGWTNLDGSRPERVRDGYALHLPRVEQL